MNWIKELFGWYDDPEPEAQKVRAEPHCDAPAEPAVEPDWEAAQTLLARASSALFALQLHLKGVSGKAAPEQAEGSRIIFKMQGAVISADTSIDGIVIFFDEPQQQSIEPPAARDYKAEPTTAEVPRVVETETLDVNEKGRGVLFASGCTVLWDHSDEEPDPK